MVIGLQTQLGCLECLMEVPTSSKRNQEVYSSSTEMQFILDHSTSHNSFICSKSSGCSEGFSDISKFKIPPILFASLGIVIKSDLAWGNVVVLNIIYFEIN